MTFSFHKDISVLHFMQNSQVKILVTRAKKRKYYFFIKFILSTPTHNQRDAYAPVTNSTAKNLFSYKLVTKLRGADWR